MYTKAATNVVRHDEAAFPSDNIGKHQYIVSKIYIWTGDAGRVRIASQTWKDVPDL